MRALNAVPGDRAAETSGLTERFADQIRDSSLSAGAVAVSPVLGASAEVADVLLDRYVCAVPENPRTETKEH